MNIVYEIGDLVYHKTNINNYTDVPFTILAFSDNKKYALFEGNNKECCFKIFPDNIVTWREMHYYLPDNAGYLAGKICYWVEMSNITLAKTIILPNGDEFLSAESKKIGSIITYKNNTYEVTEISEDKKYYYLEEVIS